MTSGNQLTSLFLYVTMDKLWLSAALPFLGRKFDQSGSQYFNNMDKETIFFLMWTERLCDRVEGIWIFSVWTYFNVIIDII